MPRDDNGQVFDVSKPNRVGADPTGRPIIVGHHPMMSDPMMRDSSRPPQPAEHKSIPVQGAGEHEFATVPLVPPTPPLAAEHPESVAAAANPNIATGADAAAAATPAGDLHLASLNDLIGHEHHQGGHSPSHHNNHPDQTGGPTAPPSTAKPPKKGKKGLWFLLILIILVVGAYLAIDDRIIKTSINLPFHVFKQPKPSVADVPLPAVTTPAAPVVPSGFTAYQLTGTPLSFDYPTVWGVPAVTTDPGYSTRSATAKSDGTYAYLVNFATNKDVQIALTSSKYLPATRTTLYYDYLQWCTGSNDAKFYKSLLHFTTASKVDTPTTTTCDQGPLTDASKLNDFTIVQLKTKNPDGTALGDLYTENLKETDLPVLRIKDASSANAVDIKKLLTTIKSSDTGSSTTSSSP